MDAEKLFKKMADSGKRLAADTLDRAIGTHVIAMIERDGEISVAALLEALQQTVDTATSAQGKADPDFDLPRLQAGAALARLQELLSQRV